MSAIQHFFDFPAIFSVINSKCRTVISQNIQINRNMRSDDGPYRIVKNSHYDFSCEPKIVTPIDSDSLGIHLNVPVYTEYLKDPSLFDYLSDPEEKIPDMMSVFKVKKDISK